MGGALATPGMLTFTDEGDDDFNAYNSSPQLAVAVQRRRGLQLGPDVLHLRR